MYDSMFHRWFERGLAGLDLAVLVILSLALLLGLNLRARSLRRGGWIGQEARTTAATLRQRYATGEIDREELIRRLQLLERGEG